MANRWWKRLLQMARSLNTRHPNGWPRTMQAALYWMRKRRVRRINEQIPVPTLSLGSGNFVIGEGFNEGPTRFGFNAAAAPQYGSIDGEISLPQNAGVVQLIDQFDDALFVFVFTVAVRRGFSVTNFIVNFVNLPVGSELRKDTDANYDYYHFARTAPLEFSNDVGQSFQYSVNIEFQES